MRLRFSGYRDCGPCGHCGAQAGYITDADSAEKYGSEQILSDRRRAAIASAQVRRVASVIATALPTMASALGITPVDMNIGITAYILAVAIFIPLSSWIGDRFGARRVFAGAIIVFTLAMSCGRRWLIVEWPLWAWRCWACWRWLM